MTHLPSPADFSFAGVVGRLRSHVNALEDTANLTDPYAEYDQRTEERTFRCYGCDEPRETEVAHCDCCGEQTTSWVDDGSFPVLPLVTRKAVSLNPDAWRA